MSLMIWPSLACLAQSVSVWPSLSRLPASSFTAWKTSPTRLESEKRKTRAATSLSFQVSSRIFFTSRGGQKGSSAEENSSQLRVGRGEAGHPHIEHRDPVELGCSEGEDEVRTQRPVQLLVASQQLLGVGDGTASELRFLYEVRQPAADYEGAPEVMCEAQNKPQEWQKEASHQSLVAEGRQRMADVK